MKNKIIGIAGGSGAGKSTLCLALQNKYFDKIGLIQMDDYGRLSENKEKIGDILNLDHPESLFIDKFVDDLTRLLRGDSVTINTKNEKLNPEYANTQKKIPMIFYPKPIMLVEGFLVLHDKRVREMLTTSIWLEACHEIRWGRRVHFKGEEYEKKVIIPMYNEYVEPTKRYAEHFIDVSTMTREQVLEKVERIIKI